MKKRTNPEREGDYTREPISRPTPPAGDVDPLAGLGGDSSLTGTPMEELGAEGPAIVDHRSPLEDFVEKNKYLLLFGFILILAAAIAFYLMKHQRETAAKEAAVAFTSAETLEDYDLVIKNHGGSVAAGNAYLRRAQLMIDSDRKNEAFSVLRKFEEQYQDHPRHAQGLVALASLEESEGREPLANDIYERVLVEHPDSELAPYAYLRQGDILLKAGDKEEAQRIFEDINPRFPRTGQVIINKVEQRLQLLGVRDEEPTTTEVAAPSAEAAAPAAADEELELIPVDSPDVPLPAAVPTE